jgi:glyoxylase-like metal-dependent hydrolase (beta-lactamase superfamily II)
MWIREPGKVTDHIEYLGAHDMCVYLLKGREYMLIEGGMSYIVPTLLRQLDESGIDPNRITKFLILHSHFDHCGAVSPIRKKFPWVQVVASHRTSELYAKEKVIHFIRDRNWDMVKAQGMEEVAEEMGLDFQDLQVDIPVGEGDVLDLGDGVTVEIMEVPGHSTCSIAAFAQPDAALFASDAGGIPNHEDVIYPAGNEDFILYQRSLEKMRKLPVQVHCAARYGAYTGEEGRNYMNRAIESAEEYRLETIDRVAKEGSVDRAVNVLLEQHMRESGTSDVPAEIMQALITNMIEVILADHEKRNGA